MASKDLDVAAVLRLERYDDPIIFLYGSDADFVDAAVSELARRVRSVRPDLAAPDRVTGDDIAAHPPVALDFFAQRGLFGENPLLIASAVSERHAKILDDLFKAPAPAPGPMMLLSSHGVNTRSKLLAAARESGFCRVARAYEAPPTRQQIAESLAGLGATHVSPDALDAVFTRAAAEDPATRAQTLALLALYAEDGRLSDGDVAACLPPSDERRVGELLVSVLEGDTRALLAWRRRGESEGVDPIQQLMFAARALSEARRALLGGGPPVFWKTDKAVKAAARRLADLDSRVEKALAATYELERAARSSDGLIAEKTERLLLRFAQLFG